MQSSVFTNSPSRDYVLSPYSVNMGTASTIRLAVPYFTRATEIVEAALRGAQIQLIIGLNPSTDPAAIKRVCKLPNCSIRFFTANLHAKIFLFNDDIVMLGSSNLTEGGLIQNLEATIQLDQPHDHDRITAVQLLFARLWEDAQILTPAVMAKHKELWEQARKLKSRESIFEEGMTEVSPSNVDVSSTVKKPQLLFVQDMQRLIYDEYLPAFNEVTAFLETGGYLRSDLANLGMAVQGNSFLNWVRRSKVLGDTWKDVPASTTYDRTDSMTALAEEWVTTSNPWIYEGYIEHQIELQRVFGSREAIEQASQETIFNALVGVNAFSEQQRYVKGGLSRLGPKFWDDNGNDLARVKDSLIHLLHSKEDFADRICDLIWSNRKLSMWGKFCCLELVGLIKPDQAPPINSRIAKALRFLGFSVRV